MNLAHPIPADILQKYEVLDRIQAGGMGAVYKARHRQMGRICVLKVIHPEFGSDPEVRERFRREAQFANRLAHPNIAQVYDFSIDDRTAAIVLEFVPGLNLVELRQDFGRPPIGLALEIARQTLKALAYLHGQGVVHRDISPDNLMLTRDADGEPLVKLIDLGIARTLNAASGLTKKGDFWGKEFYASPEQLTALASAGPQSDLFSFGIVFYELLTQAYPFEIQEASMTSRILKDFSRTDPEGRIPPDLRKVLRQALAADPRERFQTAQEFSDHLRPFLARFPVAAGDLDPLLNARSEPVPPPPAPARSQTTRVQAGPGLAPPPPDPHRTVSVPQPVAKPRARTAAPPPTQKVPAKPPTPSSWRRWLLPLAILALLIALIPTGWLLMQKGQISPRSATLAPADRPTASEVSKEKSSSGERRRASGDRENTSQPPRSAPAKKKPVPMSTPKTPPKSLAQIGQELSKGRGQEPPPVVPKEKRKPVPPTKTQTQAQRGEDFSQGRRPSPRSGISGSQPPRAGSAETPSPQKEPKPPPPGKKSTPSNKVFEIPVEVVDRGPQLVSKPQPEFPAAARGTKSAAMVVVSVSIDETGRVTKAWVERALGSVSDPRLVDLFKEAALAAARKARFEPALENGRPVDGWGELKYEFEPESP